MGVTPRAEAIVLLDSEGRRLVAKYSTPFLLAERAKQAAFGAETSARVDAAGRSRRRRGAWSLRFLGAVATTPRGRRADAAEWTMDTGRVQLVVVAEDY